MKRFVIAAALALAACQTPGEPAIEVRPVPVAVVASCVPATLPPPPVYPDTDAALMAAAGPAERLLLFAAGRLLRIARAAQTEPVLAGCQ